MRQGRRQEADANGRVSGSSILPQRDPHDPQDHDRARPRRRGGASLGSPARADHNTDHTIAQMTAHYQDPGLEVQNKPFALLYLRTTEGMRDANNAGEFSDPVFWDTEVIPTFADYYLDAYAAWQRGDLHDVDPAWRIAFRPTPTSSTAPS